MDPQYKRRTERCIRRRKAKHLKAWLSLCADMYKETLFYESIADHNEEVFASDDTLGEMQHMSGFIHSPFFRLYPTRSKAADPPPRQEQNACDLAAK